MINGKWVHTLNLMGNVEDPNYPALSITNKLLTQMLSCLCLYITSNGDLYTHEVGAKSLKITVKFQEGQFVSGSPSSASKAQQRQGWLPQSHI